MSEKYKHFWRTDGNTPNANLGKDLLSQRGNKFEHFLQVSFRADSKLLELTTKKIDVNREEEYLNKSCRFQFM